MIQRPLTAPTVIGVYLLLATALAAAWILWPMVPRTANHIIVYDVQGRVRMEYDQVRYRMSTDKLTVWRGGQIIYHPLSAVSQIDVTE